MASVFNMLRRTLSGESERKQGDVDSSHESPTSMKPSDSVESTESNGQKIKQSKRYRSGDPPSDVSMSRQKRKKLSKTRVVQNESSVGSNDEDLQSSTESDGSFKLGQADELPEGTPDWGVKLLEIIQKDLKAITKHVSTVEKTGETTKCDVRKLEDRLEKVELQNRELAEENINLKERLLDVEYRQRQCNLIFEGIPDADQESDGECIGKLRSALSHITGRQGFNAQRFVIDKCFRIDGAFRVNQNRRVLCTFNWQRDVQVILKNRRWLPKGLYVNEDMPEEWIDRRRILKPLFVAAKKKDSLKKNTYMTKDRLVIDGTTITAAPVMNVIDAERHIDIPGSCQKTDPSGDKTIFLGCHSVFSNLHYSPFTMDNVMYSCVEQRLQCMKAVIFDDDKNHAKIMKETNPFKMKKLGSKVKNFKQEKWNKMRKSVAYSAIFAKFAQNRLLKELLLSTGDSLIAESSTDPFWGTGLHLNHKNALDKQYWTTENGGAMCEMYTRLKKELQ